MKLKNGLTITLLALAAAGVIFLGTQQRKNEQKNLEKTSMIHAGSTQSKDSSALPASSEKEKLEIYKASLSDLSLIEYLDYVSLSSKETPKISFYGDVTQDDLWVRQLESQVPIQLGTAVDFMYGSFPELDSYDLYIQQTVSSLSETSETTPDVIVFRPSPVGDQIRDIGLAETQEYIENILQSLSTHYPNAKVFFLEAEPKPAFENVRNSRSLTYLQYAAVMKEVSETESVPVLSVNEAFQKEGEAESTILYDTDGSHLSESGHQLYADLLLENMNQRQ